MKKNSVPYEVIDRFYHCLLDYKDFLDGHPYDSNNSFDSFVKMRKCETCDTIFDMFCEIVFDNPDNPNIILDFTFTPLAPDEYLNEYNLLYSKKTVVPKLNSSEE